MTAAPAAASATYLYCLLRANAAPPTASAPAGVPGAGRARELDAGEGLWLVVASTPLPEYSGELLEERLQDVAWVSSCAVAHEAVVEHFLDAEALVPMKLLTLFATDQRALEHVRERRQELGTILDRVAGHREWGVRVRFDPASAPAGDRAPEAAAVAPASGREFLLRKSRQRQAARALGEEARQGAIEAWEELAALATEAHQRPPVTPEASARMLLEASFLVPSGETPAFEGAVERCAARLAGRSCEVTLTGPWPPYSFVGEA